MANILMHVNNQGDLLCFGNCPLAQTLKDGQPREVDVYLHHAAGHRVPVAVKVLPVFGEGEQAGEVVGAVEIFSENASLDKAQMRIQELQREALVDDLTGIGNRRVTTLRLDLALEGWEKNQVPIAALMLDIDLFKQINDTHGHATGDQVLKMVSNSLSSGLRSYDFLGRWGGEEFVAILANVNQDEMVEIAERVRMLVETSLFFLDENDRKIESAIRVTVSVGGAMAQPGETLETLLQRADQNMYKSKAAGRNRITI